MSQLTQRRHAVFVEILPDRACCISNLSFHAPTLSPLCLSLLQPEPYSRLVTNPPRSRQARCAVTASAPRTLRIWHPSTRDISRTERSFSQSGHRCTFRGTSALSKFVNLLLGLLQSVRHVHLAVHRGRRGEVLLRLLTFARAPVELAEAEVAVGDERGGSQSEPPAIRWNLTCP